MIAEPREARDVGRVHDLRVLVAQAQVACTGHLARHTLEDAQHLVVGPIADGVYGGLETRLRCGTGDGIEPVRRGHEQAAVAGLVRIVLVESGAARSERTVGDQLHRTHGQAVLVDRSAALE